MAEVFHQSTVEHASTQLDSKETLVRFLDDLLERYLHLLDQYQILQQSLAQCLSTVRNVLANPSTRSETAQGYLLLAQANYSNPNHVRYSQEHYDDRMQASTRMYVTLILVYQNLQCA